MKCKHSKKCKLYDSESLTCNKTGGLYYEDNYAGCYRRLEVEDE